MLKHFSCESCSTTQPFSTMFKNLRDNAFVCLGCQQTIKATLRPWVVKNWFTVNIMGFSSVVVPAEFLLYYLKKSFLFSIIIAFACELSFL